MINGFQDKFTKKFFSEINKECKPFESVFLNKRKFFYNKFYYYEKLLNFFTKLLFKNEYYITFLNKNSYIENNFNKFHSSFELLNDQYSKDKFVEFIISKLLANRQLSIISKYSSSVKKDLSKLNNHFSNSTNVRNRNEHDLSSIGYDAKLIATYSDILALFIFKQYEYKHFFKVEAGDIVIDCGGATGDTPIYFASKKAKKVYVYEFIESNIELFKKQINLNPKYKTIIEIINKPVWSDTNTELSYLDNGHGSKVDSKGVYPNSVKTLSIDDMITSKKVNKVNFIKMDIEGAEIPALKGAVKTIKKHKPKLAISAYHKKDDLITITELIKKFNPNYQIYFDYHTDIGWEAVLYAIDKKSLRN